MLPHIIFCINDNYRVPGSDLPQIFASKMTDQSLQNHPFEKHELLAVTVRLAAFTIHRGSLYVAVDRSQRALPGRLVQNNEALDDTLQWELSRIVNLDEPNDCYVEQIGSYLGPPTDAQQRGFTVAYLVVAPEQSGLAYRTHRNWTRVLPEENQEVISLPTEQEQIVTDSLERIRSLLEYTTFASRFLEQPFTVSELRRVYELIWGTRIDSGNFRRNIDKSGGYVSEGTPSFETRSWSRQRGRPASLWSATAERRQNNPGTLLKRALASRDRQGSLLGIRTRPLPGGQNDLGSMVQGVM